jgi:hypothetical protein
MPKKIQVAQLRVGMYLQGLDGSWLDHPFWRTKFLIRTESELNKLRECGVSECWIDPSKGEDAVQPVPDVALAGAESAGASDSAAAPQAMPTLAPSANPEDNEAAEPTTKAGFVDELERAAGIRERAGAALAELLDQVRQRQPLKLDRCTPVLDEIRASMTAITVPWSA